MFGRRADMVNNGGVDVVIRLANGSLKSWLSSLLYLDYDWACMYVGDMYDAARVNRIT